jgi:hypothetical protein
MSCFFEVMITYVSLALSHPSEVLMRMSNSGNPKIDGFEAQDILSETRQLDISHHSAGLSPRSIQIVGQIFHPI